MGSIASAVGSSSESTLVALLLSLAILIASAKVLGSIAVSLRQPAVLGELVAGVLLGPTFINVLELPIMRSVELGAIIHEFGQLGVILLMFAAGMEIELHDLRVTGKPAAFAGVLGVLAPMALGTGVSLALGVGLAEAAFMGIVLSATSVSISAQTLLELRRLRSREGVALLGAAVIDDVLVIMGLSAYVLLARGEGSAAEILGNLGQMSLVLALVAVFSVLALPRIAEWGHRLRASEGLLAITLSLVLFLAWVTEAVGGVAAITGAFVAGLGLGRSHLRAAIERGLHRIAYAFFVPLFLVDIGLQSNMLAATGAAIPMTIAIVVVAFVSKPLGAGLGAWLGGFDRSSSLRMGLGMISRGEVGLIVAGVGIQEGILSSDQFATAILMVLLTTMATPVLLRWAYARQETNHASNGDLGD